MVDPIEVSPLQLVSGSRALQGWAADTPAAARAIGRITQLGLPLLLAPQKSAPAVGGDIAVVVDPALPAVVHATGPKRNGG